MNALQQLAEREFPKRIFGIGVGAIDTNYWKRLAFIRGAKLAVEFMKHMRPGAHDDWYDENFEIFLTSKLKGDELE